MSATKEHYHDQIEAGQRGKQHPIGWLNMPGYKPETWNPIVGCSKVSPGCDNCYAERMAFRIAQMQLKNHGKNGYHYTEVSKLTSIGWTGETRLVYNQLNWPLVWKSPRMVFVCSMGDLFHETVSHESLKQVFQIIHDNPQHIFIVLTKRPDRMAKFFSLLKNGDVETNFPNVWLGVTAENQEQANKRIPILLQIPAAKRFVSIEPMLGPVDLTAICPAKIETISLNVLSGFATNQTQSFRDGLPVLDWVICGGESGPKARPMHPDWVYSLREQCTSANVPFFFKQWGEWQASWGAGNHLVNINTGETVKGNHNDIRAWKIGGWEPVLRVGRKAAGDLLDERQYQEWPKINL